MEYLRAIHSQASSNGLAFLSHIHVLKHLQVTHWRRECEEKNLSGPFGMYETSFLYSFQTCFKKITHSFNLELVKLMYA